MVETQKKVTVKVRKKFRPFYAQMLVIGLLVVLIVALHVAVFRTVGISKSSEMSRPIVEPQQNIDSDVFNTVDFSKSPWMSKPSEVSKQKKRIIYLHVGAPKCASTTIQSTCQDKRIEDTMQRDGFLYPPLHLRKLVDETCLNPLVLNIKPKTNFSIWKEACAHALNDLLKLSSNTSNYFYSGEKIGQRMTTTKNWAIWGNSLQDWDVRIIIVYRRYHEWLLSWEQQRYKQFQLFVNAWKKGVTVNAWKTGILRSHRQDHIRYYWDHATGYSSTKLVTLWGDVLNGTAYHAISIYDHFAPIYNNIHLVNMHEEIDVVENLFCNTMKEMTTTCAYLRKYRDDIDVNRNPAVFDGYDRIAMAAYKDGLIDDSFSKKEVIELIQLHQEKTLQKNSTDFPMDCASKKELQALLQLSLAFEKRLFPDFFNSELGEERLRSSFQEMVDKRKFCSIDERRVLRSDTWNQFFARLKNNTEALV